MQSRRKVILASLMLFLVFWNGVLGSAAVARLCLHQHGLLHFEHGTCEAAHEDAHAEHGHESERACSDYEFADAVLDDAAHCYDFELKGLDDDFLFSARAVWMSQSGYTDLLSYSVDRFIAPRVALFRTKVAPRAPPLAARLSKQIVATTVFRL